MAEPTIIEIHNYAGGSAGSPKSPEGRVVSQLTSPDNYPGWGWGPSFGDGPMPQIDFVKGKTYVVYELDSDE